VADVRRDTFSAQLDDVTDPTPVTVLEVTFWNRDEHMTVSAHRTDLPFELVEQFLRDAPALVRPTALGPPASADDVARCRAMVERLDPDLLLAVDEVDRTLIREALARTPLERLALNEQQSNGIDALRRESWPAHTR
jgi:hypothetical protein